MRQDTRDVERVRRLMMAVLDEEATQAERAELEAALASEPALRAEWQRLRRVKEVTSTMKPKEPPREVWETYWTGVYRRLERGLAWILISIGAMALISYGLWMGVQDVLTDADLPVWMKGAFLALLVGGVILLVSVVREKLFLWRRDPYRDVQR